MGLFSGLKHILGAIAPVVGTALGGPLGGAIGGGVSALLGGNSNKGAVSGANAAQQAAIAQAIQGFNANQATDTANFNPWIHGGQSAFGNELDLLGTNGNGPQGSAIDALKASPLYQSLFHNGQDTVLNNLSATGGLRGGNATGSLYNLGTDTLAQTIQQQIANLSGASGQGLNAAGQLGQFGQQNTSSIADLLLGAGKANAGSILGQQAVDNNTDSQLGKLFGGAGIGDQIKRLLQGFGGGGGSILSGAGSGFGSGGGALPNFPRISSSLPSAGFGLPF